MEKLVRLDSQGRITIPREIRDARGLGTGDRLVAEYDPDTGQIILRSEINPFDVLAAQALEEYRAGQTIPLQELMAELGIEPEHDQD